MIRKDLKIRNGIKKTYITVVQGYRPGPKMPPKQRTIKSFGYLEDQDDPVLFMQEVEEFNKHCKDEEVPLRIEVYSTTRMYTQENRRMNYGYKYLEVIYDMLGITEFIKKQERKEGFKGSYSLSEIFKFLVLLRILSPDSKRANCQMKDNFYGMQTTFTLPDVYRSLDRMARAGIPMQRHLNEVVKEKIGRDLSYAFYDVTNYYCEIDFPDGADDLRKKGVSKEHRVDPIVAMGLFIDGNGLPVSMNIFPGNTSESLTLQPTMADIKESYGLGRLIVVADKGLNSSKNIDAVVNAGDGFVFSQILRGKKGQRYNEELFSDKGWMGDIDGSYRYKLFEEGYKGKDKEGKSVTRKRKVLIYWDRGDAEMARYKREEKLAKAERNVKNNAYSIKKGVDEYTKEMIIAKKTGEVLEDITKRRSVDHEKAEKDSMYDGYFCIITSELDYPERKIRQAYGGLWRVEQSFRMMKSDLYARPIFVSKNEHIQAHFLICFVALLIIRTLQHLMGENVLSAERIATALGAAVCRVHKGGIVQLDDVGGQIAFKKVIDKNGKLVETLEFSDDDQIALDYKSIQDVFGMGLYNVYSKQEVFNKFLKSISVP